MFVILLFPHQLYITKYEHYRVVCLSIVLTFLISLSIYCTTVSLDFCYESPTEFYNFSYTSLLILICIFYKIFLNFLFFYITYLISLFIVILLLYSCSVFSNFCFCLLYSSFVEASPHTMQSSILTNKLVVQSKLVSILIHLYL